MSTSITDLMQQVHDHFLNLYQTQTTLANQDTFLAFDSGASPPISIESFRQPGQVDFSDPLATEEFSSLVNEVPQLNPNRFSPNGNQVEEQYEMLVLGGMSQSTTEDDQVFFGRMRDEAEQRLRNSKVGRARIGAPPIPYCISFAKPNNWYRPDVPGNWTSYRVAVTQTSQTQGQTKPVFIKRAVDSAIALDLTQAWTLQVLPETLTPVLTQPEILDRIAVQEIAPQIDRKSKSDAPVRFRREDLLRSVAAGDQSVLKSLQPNLIAFDRAILSQRIAAFMPKAAFGDLADRNILRSPKVRPGLEAQVIVQPVIQPVVKQPIGKPLFDRSILMGRNNLIKQIINQQILEQSRTEAIQSSQLSVTFEYCWVNIDRRWFYNPYLQTRNWSIPGFEAGELSRGKTIPLKTPAAFPAIAIAVLLVRNLRIQANWQAQEFQSVQSSAALGPFSLVGRSIEQGTNIIVQPGMQVMAWACQVMPTLPPSPAPV